MNAREELENFYLLSIKAKTLQNRIDRLEAMVNRVNSWPDNSPVQGGKSSHIDLVSRLIEMKEVSDCTIKGYLEEYERIMAKIDKIDDPLLAELILERYVDGLLWADIAKNINMSESHTKGYLHRKAIEIYSDI